MYTDHNQIASGFGIDLGLYGQINNKVSAQLSIMNLYVNDFLRRRTEKVFIISGSKRRRKFLSPHEYTYISTGENADHFLPRHPRVETKSLYC